MEKPRLSTMGEPRTLTGSWADVAVGVVAATLILGLLMLFAWQYDPASPDPKLLILLSGVAGAALGWPTGIILSPYDDPREQRTFKDISKAAYGVAVGYLVAKLDPIVTSLVSEASHGTMNPLVGVSAVVGITAFVVVTTLAYVSRKYWL